MASGERYFNSDKPKSLIEKEIILIVEGKDDAYFFDSLLEELGADPQNVGIVIIKGKDALSENLALLKKSRRYIQSGIKRIAIIRDADESGQQSLEAVQVALKAHGLASPDHAAFDVVQGTPEVGVFIVPSSADDGDLERVCLETIGGDVRLGMVITFIDDVQKNLGPLNRIYKRRAAAYFAVSPTENRGVGWTFKNTDMFNQGHVSLNEIRNFLQYLIN